MSIDTPTRRWSPLPWLLQRYWRMTRGLTLGSQVCVIDSHGRILLVRHGYRPGWHFPGGGVEKGENARAAAMRELAEETGIVAVGALDLHGIFDNGRIFPGDHVVVFVARAYQSTQVPAPSFEIAEQRFFAPDALPPDIAPGAGRRVAEIIYGVPIVTYW